MKYLIPIVLCLATFHVVADNRSDQMNPNNDAYYQSRGYDERPDDWETNNYSSSTYSSSVGNNRSNQLNPNNDAYYRSRGYDKKPDDWESESTHSSPEYNNRSNQLNPNNDAYSKSRGYEGKSKTNWENNLNNSEDISATSPIKVNTLLETDKSEKDISNDEKTTISEANYMIIALKLLLRFLSIR